MSNRPMSSRPIEAFENMLHFIDGDPVKDVLNGLTLVQNEQIQAYLTAKGEAPAQPFAIRFTREQYLQLLIIREGYRKKILTAEEIESKYKFPWLPDQLPLMDLIEERLSDE